MKKTVLVATLGVLTLSLTSSQARAPREEWAPGAHMMEAVTHMLHSYDVHGKDSSFGLDKGTNPNSSMISNSILGAFIAKGKNQSWTRDFQADTEYLIVGGGGSDVKDLDIVVTDAAGKVVAKDEDDDAEPFVKFQVPAKGRYTIKLLLEDSKDDADFCTMAVMQDEGWDIDFHELTTAVKNVLDDCAAQNEKNEPEGINFYEKSFCLFGTVLAKGQYHSGTNLKKGDHGCLLFVGGQEGCDTVEASLTGDMWIFGGTSPDDKQVPKVSYIAKDGDKNGWSVKNTSKSDATPIVVTLLCQDLHN